MRTAGERSRLSPGARIPVGVKAETRRKNSTKSSHLRRWTTLLFSVSFKRLQRRVQPPPPVGAPSGPYPDRRWLRNNAHWVKKNQLIYEPPTDFQQSSCLDHHATVQETSGRVRTPGTCMTALPSPPPARPLHHCSTAIGQMSQSRTPIDPLLLSVRNHSALFMCYSASWAPNRRHSASVYVLLLRFSP